MVIDNKVYDATPFLLEHPGGEDILIDSSGRDATREFEDVGHSSEARAQLENLLIGTLREPTPEEKEAASQENIRLAESNQREPGVFTQLAKWLFPFFLIGVAYLLRKYT